MDNKRQYLFHEFSEYLFPLKQFLLRSRFPVQPAEWQSGRLAASATLIILIFHHVNANSFRDDFPFDVSGPAVSLMSP